MFCPNAACRWQGVGLGRRPRDAASGWGLGGVCFLAAGGLKVEAEGGRQVRGHFSLLKTRARRPAVPLGPGQGRGACETSGSISFKDGSPQGQVGAEDELIFPPPPTAPSLLPIWGILDSHT